MEGDQYNTANNDTKPFTTPPPISKHKKHSNKCFVYTLFIIVLLSISLLIAGLVFARIKTPTLRISNAVVRDLYYIDNPSADSTSAPLNVTIASKILLHNMNFGGFEFHGASTTLLYGNSTIGTGGNIGKDRIGSREKKELNVDFYLIGIENISNNSYNNYELSRNFSRDVSLGMVKMRSYTELRGRVSVLKIMNRHRTAVMNCTVDLNLTSKAIQGLLCL